MWAFLKGKGYNYFKNGNKYSEVSHEMQNRMGETDPQLA